MVRPSTTTLGHANRLRNSRGSLLNIVTMSTVRCETCGDHYAIEHPFGAEDSALAKRQASWLTDGFRSDHVLNNKHPASIPLPDLR